MLPQLMPLPWFIVFIMFLMSLMSFLIFMNFFYISVSKLNCFVVKKKLFLFSW